MSNRLTAIVIAGLILLTIVVGALAYPLLPERVASHWNAAGQADGTMTKFWGIFLFPIIMAVMALLALIIPRLDPLRENARATQPALNVFWVFLHGFFAYLCGLVVAWNLGYSFSFTRWLLPAFAALWLVIAWLLRHAQRNWFVGIRTPWTLSSDVVWQKTHALASKLFGVGAVLALVAIAFPAGQAAFWLTVGWVLCAALASVVYSYIVYRQVGKQS